MISNNSQVQSKNNRIAKNTVMLYLRMGLSMAISLYTSRIVMKELGINDFGLYNVIAGAVVLLAFVNGALASSTQRYLSFEIGKAQSGQLRLVFNQAIFIHFIFSIIVLIFAESVGLWFLDNKMVIPPCSKENAFWVYQLSICTVVLSVIQVPYTSMIMSMERMSVYAYIGLLEVIIKLLIAFAIGLFHNNKVVWYAGFIFGAALLHFVIYVSYCFIKFDESKLLFKIDRAIIRSFSSFAGWNLFGAVAWTGKNQGLNIILNMFFGTAINAAYGVTNQVNNAVNSFVQNFSVAVAPQIVKSYSSGDYDRMNKLIFFGSKISFLLLFILVFPISVVIEPLLRLWLVDVPPNTAIFIRLLFCVSLLESFTYTMGNAIQATGKIKYYHVLIGSTTIANLPISWVLLKAGAHAQIVFVTSICLAALSLIERIWISDKQIPQFSAIQYIKNSIFPCIVIFIIGVLIVGITSQIQFSTILLWGGVAPISFITGIVLVVTVGLNTVERNKISYAIKHKVNILTKHI